MSDIQHLEENVFDGDEVETEGETSQSFSSNAHDIDRPPESSSRASSRPSSRPSSRQSPRVSSQYETQIDKLLHTVEQTWSNLSHQNESPDSISHFCDSLKDRLRSLDSAKLMLCEIEILQVIAKHMMSE